MAHVVAIANQKGGVGKTTTAVNLAASLAIAERRTLLLDADPQGNATSGVGVVKHELQSSIYDSIVEGRPASEVLVPVPGLPHRELLPATQDLVGAELQLVDRPHREAALRAVLDGIKARYDYVIVDCPPSLGLLTLNVLAGGHRTHRFNASIRTEGISQLSTPFGWYSRTSIPDGDQWCGPDDVRRTSQPLSPGGGGREGILRREDVRDANPTKRPSGRGTELRQADSLYDVQSVGARAISPSRRS
jgi:hypothetical protein